MQALKKRQKRRLLNAQTPQNLPKHEHWKRSQTQDPKLSQLSQLSSLLGSAGDEELEELLGDKKVDRGEKGWKNYVA